MTGALGTYILFAREEKRIRELAESARRRAQRRKAFYDSRLGDPTQLLRVSGTATRLVANPESYTFHEDPSSLMPWAGDSNVLIDRFDGRALLDFLPTDAASVVDSGLRPDRDEDGIGNELRFERWHDLADKIRLHITEEQCLLDNEEEWNDLVARHHALIGKVSEKKRDSTAEGTASRPSFAFDYGTNAAQPDSAVGQVPEKELTALEEENIFDHLDDLTSRDRSTLDSLGKEFYIKDYYRVLRIAKEEEDERVNQLKVTAVNLERALAGKKPLKASEIEGLTRSPAKNQGRGGQGSRRHRNRRKRSRSPSSRGGRRSSPSYEPYHDTSSRSGSESPFKDKVEFIQEFKIGSPRQDVESGGDYDYYDMDTSPSSSTPLKSAASRSIVVTQGSTALRNSSALSSSQAGQGGIDTTKMTLAEKLKYRMRQGLEQSVAVAIEAQGDGTGVAAQVQLGGESESGQETVGIVRKRAHGAHRPPGDQGVARAVRPEVILNRNHVGVNETILGLDRELLPLLLEYSPDAGQGLDLVHDPVLLKKT
ncbi:hypothetical protein K457DRAFT_129116 [Linnemannia elongata AG-77]|uniref:Suppressor of white apricot N-terminal domain-containing protein n=1 Tax=Linnemannia elongata AG-77 TaxID=1314771 RepID=A0A197JM37_9FUNG|nr:hypothetical protein K457DRAFT_129116 [Linnemannia elongata AG-77]